MEKGTKITVGLITFIVLIAAGGILYKENFYIDGDVVENTKGQQVKADTVIKTESSDDNSTISDITAADKGEIVTISGIIDEVERSKDGQHLFVTLSDGTDGMILVPIFSNTNIDQTQFIVGENLKVTGEVEIYGGDLEIIPQTSEDVVCGNNLTTVTQADINKEATIKGTIISKYNHPDGHIFLTVQLESGQEIDVPIFSTLAPNPENYTTNSVVQVKGTVDLYDGKLEVIPNTLDEITVINVGEIQTFDYVEIGSITEDNRGDSVYIKGIVSDVYISNNKDIFFNIRDNSGEIKGVQFIADTEVLPDKQVVLELSDEYQTEISIMGTVDVYDDTLEVIADKVWNY